MTIITPAPRPRVVRVPHPRPAVPGGGGGGGRDRAVDLVRAACLLAVVGVHALMVGVSVSDGVPVLENALERWDGFTVFSWIAQMMPLFFIMGGFASAQHFRRMRERGATAPAYVAARIGRLLPVPLLATGATLVALIVLSAAGLDPDLVATAGWRISQPLWFLGVYVLCSALVPVMLRLHERAPRATLLGLGIAIAAVDGVRAATGADAVGFANLLFVWLFVQQLGFRLADGSAPSRRSALIALGGIVALIALGLSPANLFEALNPPTAALALLGVVQCAVFAAVRPRLARWAELPAVRRASDALNGCAMTVYSWHMPVVVLLAGLLLLAGSALPTPLSPEWWASRPVWLAAAGIAVAAVVAAVARIERGSRAETPTAPADRAAARIAPTAPAAPAAPVAPAAPAAPTVARVALGVVCGASGVLAVLAGTGSIGAWAIGAALMGAGLLACRGRAARRIRPNRPDQSSRPAGSTQNAKAMPISTP